MLRRFTFGKMTPDQSGEGIELARNVLPDPKGYGPVKSFEQFTPAITGWLGGGAFVAKDGSTTFLSGNATNLYRFGGATWSSVLVHAATTWRMVQFGDNIICVNGAAPVTYNMGTDSAAVTAGSPPVSDLAAVVREFVVLAGNPAQRDTVTWSGFNNSAQWTAGTNQSGAQDMLDIGEVMGLAGGEYGVILGRQGIKRMNFVGDDLVFTFDKISDNTGCMAKGSVAQAGRLVFFLSERGFQYTEGNDAIPIGVEDVDETFFETYARSQIKNIKSAVDPSRHLVIWAMPGRLWVYNWVLKRWAVIDITNLGVFSGFNADISIDAVDAVLGGNLDTLGISLDSKQLQGGNPLFLVVSGDGTIGTLSGVNMEASISVPDHELLDGLSHVNCVRHVSDAYNSTVEMRGKLHAGATEVIKTTSTRRSNGDLPIRIRSRVYKSKVTIPANENWTYSKALEYRFESGGRR